MYQQISGQFHNNNNNPIQSSPIRTNVYNKQLLNQTYHTTTSQQNKTIVNNAQQQNLYKQNVEKNVNLYRQQRKNEHQARIRNPLQHRNVGVQEDLPRLGWKVEFESGASDSALSPDMPDYFLTSKYFEVAKHETTSALGKDISHLNAIQHLDGAEHSSGMVTNAMVTNLRGEERILDDSAISDDAPLWWRNQNTIISKNLGYKHRDAMKQKQLNIMTQHINGYHERNPVLQKWPKHEPLDIRITGDKGVKVDFGPNGPTDSAISADLPDYFLTNPNYEVVNHVKESKHGTNNQILAGVGTGVKSSTIIGSKTLSDTSISGDMPTWCIKGASEVNPVPLSKYNKDATPRINLVNVETKLMDDDNWKKNTSKSKFAPKRGSQLDTVLNWDKKIEKINNNLTNKKMMRRSGSEIISPTTNRRNNNNNTNNKFNIAVTSNGINVYDLAKQTKYENNNNYRHANKNNYNWKNTNGAPRLNVGPRSGQDTFSRDILGNVFSPTVAPNTTKDFQPYDHRSAHRSGWNAPPRERSQKPIGPYTAGYRKWD